MIAKFCRALVLSGLALIGTGSANAATVLWSLGAGGNGHFYDVVLADNPDWHTARAAAATQTYQGRVGHLATFTTRPEQEFVIQQLGGVQPALARRFPIGGVG